MGEWHGDTDYPDYPYSEKQAAINDVGEVVEGCTSPSATRR